MGENVKDDYGSLAQPSAGSNLCLAESPEMNIFPAIDGVILSLSTLLKTLLRDYRHNLAQSVRLSLFFTSYDKKYTSNVSGLCKQLWYQNNVVQFFCLFLLLYCFFLLFKNKILCVYFIDVSSWCKLKNVINKAKLQKLYKWNI